MKRTKIKNTAIYIVLLIMFGLVAQSCHSGKKCGCEGDLMGNYKAKRHKY